ncbi:PA2169 family four-helix-bundle protein [Deinococcus petrolearius]|uniref:PA2169 family four-helix-bundle protein n=1 Tax=Deinococcus petrolearius TaxID=1751295 RepID=A0ABW1DNN1_9DEIO
MTMNNDQAVDHLQKLLGTVRDGETGFRDAAEHAEAASLKTLFQARSAQRTKLAAELEAKITALGSQPRERGSVGAALHRTWLNVRDAVTGRDDYAVVAEAERGEDVAISNYQEALNDAALPADLRDFVQAQYAQVKSSHDEIRDLKHRMEADKK